MKTELKHDAPTAPQTDAQPTINYESYLLRLRRMTGPAGVCCQVCLLGIGDDEERYFNSLRELMACLQQGDGTREEGPSPFATSEG